MASTELDPHRPWGLDNLPAADRARRTHTHVYTVIRVQFCLEDCAAEHRDDYSQAHHTCQHVASTRERAEAYIRANATTDLTVGWEVWEEAVDAYDPYEAPDDDGEFWRYAGDGTLLNYYEWWQRYEQPLYGWAWHGHDAWRDEAMARA